MFLIGIEFRRFLTNPKRPHLFVDISLLLTNVVHALHTCSRYDFIKKSVHYQRTWGEHK